MGLEIPLPENIETKVGILTDRDIIEALNSGFLFEKGTYIDANAKYSSYEIRVGGEYQRLRFEEENVAHIPLQVEEKGVITILPGQTVLVTAQEQFRIPTDVFAKITTVGQIFSSGLAAENTFADPGYTGPLYITLSNISTRTLSIKRGDPLARVEFHRLSRPVGRHHQGYKGIRPNFVKATLDKEVRKMLSSKTVEDLLKDMVEKSVDEALAQRYMRSEVLIEKAHVEIAKLRVIQAAIQKLRYLTAVIIAAVTFLVINSYGLFARLNIQEFWEFILSVIASILASIVFVLIDRKYGLTPKRS